MNNRFNHQPPQPVNGGAFVARHATAPTAQKRKWLLLDRRAVILLLTLFGIILVYSLHLHRLRETRRQVRAELTHLLQTEKFDPTGIIAAFDRSTEDVFFAACGPYFILAVTVIFLTSQLLGIKQRLNAAERHTRTLQNVVLGIGGGQID